MTRARHRLPAGPQDNVTAFPRRASRRIAFTLPQLAAAAIVVAAVSGGLCGSCGQRRSGSASHGVHRIDVDGGSGSVRGGSAALQGCRCGRADDVRIETVGMADAQYDAAVADLEKALKTGRGRLDSSTIAIVEHNLQIIDQAINQAREALVGDPANTYLSSHLVEARRRKLDLLRRATALTTDMN